MKIAAALLSLLTACQWSMGPKHPDKPPSTSRYLSEDDARDLISERFAAQSIYFTEDFAYSRNDVEFTVDGFNEDLGIGYDYLSINDDPDLTSTEKSLLETSMEQGGDAILIIESGTTYTSIEERSLIKTRLEEFIILLKSTNRI